MRHQVAGDLQTLLHAAGKGGRQVVDPVGGNFHLFQPLLRGGANVAVMTRPGRHQPLADIAACRDLAAQAVERMLMHHAPFGAQQATAVGLAHCVQRTALIVNLPCCGVRRAEIDFSSVVFPEPDSPTMPSTSLP